MHLVIWTVGITSLLALLGDSKAAFGYATYVIGIRGITFICVKITEVATKNYSQIIDMAGWSLAVVSMVKIVLLAMKGMDKVNSFVTGFNASDKSFWDKITW